MCQYKNMQHLSNRIYSINKLYMLIKYYLLLLIKVRGKKFKKRKMLSGNVMLSVILPGMCWDIVGMIGMMCVSFWVGLVCFIWKVCWRTNINIIMRMNMGMNMDMNMSMSMGMNMNIIMNTNTNTNIRKNKMYIREYFQYQSEESQK